MHHTEITHSIRKCSSEDAVKVFEALVVDNSPSKIRHVGRDTTLLFKKGKKKIAFKITENDESINFQFFTGVDKIVFVGSLLDSSAIESLSFHANRGKNSSVLDYL
jgi:hypothetical protein